MKKEIVIVVLGLFLVLAVWLISTASTYSSKLMLCNAMNGDCQTFAKFKEYEDCESLRVRWAWYCDQTNKQNIVCHEGEGAVARTYCTK